MPWIVKGKGYIQIYEQALWQPLFSLFLGDHKIACCGMVPDVISYLQLH